MDLILLLIVAVLLGSALIALVVMRRDVKRLSSAAESALASGKHERALKLYEKVVRIVTSGQQKLPADRSKPNASTLIAAHLALGSLYAQKGEPPRAFENYRRAKELGAHLPEAGISVLAEGYAERREAGAEGVEAYLAYLQLPAKAKPSERVYAMLQSVCTVDETSKAAARKTAVGINRQVVKFEPALEWPHYFIGLALLLDGNFTASIESFNVARSLNPKRALTYYWLGVCHLQKTETDLESASALISKFLSFSDQTGKILKRQAKAAYELSRRMIAAAGGFEPRPEAIKSGSTEILARAIDLLRTATDRDPSQSSYHFTLGRAYSLARNSSQAITAYEAAVSCDPNEKEYYYYLAKEQTVAGLLDCASHSLGVAIRIDPDYLEAHALLTQVFLKDGHFGEAEIHARSWMRLSGNAYQARASLVSALYYQEHFDDVVAEATDFPWATIPIEDASDTLFRIARSYSRLGRFEEARDLYERIPDQPIKFYYLGCTLARLDRKEAALKLFERLSLENGPYASAALLQQGHLLLEGKGGLEAAHSSYVKAWEKEPRNPDVLYALAYVLYCRGDFEGAHSKLTQIIEIQAHNSRAYLALGAICERNGDASQAIHHYEVSSVDPALRNEALLRLAVLHCRAKSYDTALTCLADLDNGQQGDAVLFCKATALSLTGRSREAVQLWEQLCERHPADEGLVANLCRTQYLLGSQCVGEGLYAEAVVAWEKYLAAYPRDSKVSADLSEVCYLLAAQERACPAFS